MPSLDLVQSQQLLVSVVDAGGVAASPIADHLDSIHLNVALLSGAARRNEVPEKEIRV